MRNAAKIGAVLVILLLVLAVYIFLAGGYRYIGQVSPLRSACERGDAFACYRVGKMYEVGEYVSVNLLEARSYYRRACSVDPKWGCGDALRLEYLDGGSTR